MTNAHYTLLYHYYGKKKINDINHQTLEIIVILNQSKLPFTHSTINESINQLEDQLMSQSKSINNYSIFMIKKIDILTDEEIQMADQVTFEKHGKHHINVINGLYVTSDQSVYMLFSDKHSPNIYYQYTVDFIKSII